MLALRYGLDDGVLRDPRTVRRLLHLSFGQVAWLERLALTRLRVQGVRLRDLRVLRLLTLADAEGLLTYARQFVKDPRDEDAVHEVTVALCEGRDPHEAYDRYRKQRDRERFGEVPWTFFFG